jgi:hypothetical protein
MKRRPKHFFRFPKRFFRSPRHLARMRRHLKRRAWRKKRHARDISDCRAVKKAPAPAHQASRDALFPSPMTLFSPPEALEASTHGHFFASAGASSAGVDAFSANEGA